MSDSYDPTDCSLPGSPIHGIFQARVLEWGAIAFSTVGLEQHPNQRGHWSTRMSRMGVWGVGRGIYSEVGLFGEKAMAPHSSTLAWRTPWMEEPGRLQSMGSLRVRHD